MSKEKKAIDKLYPLEKQDIVIYKLPVAATDLILATNLQSGGRCTSITGPGFCDSTDGCRWNSGASKCVDVGSGDWD